MQIDENQFFREVTLRICGNLEIEEGLRACSDYLSRYMPVDQVYLYGVEKSFETVLIIARATSFQGERMNKALPFPAESKKDWIEGLRALEAGTVSPVIIIGNTDKEPFSRYVLDALGEPSMSAMSLPLVVEGELVGAVALVADGHDRYNEHHADLFSTLKKPFFVAISNAIKHQEIIRLKDMLLDENRYLYRELKRITGDRVVGATGGLKHVMKMIRQVAPVDSPVVLLGETGVGKEVIANAIHDSSSRGNGPFIKVNCGAIPETLMDSELFGHEKGAFTGALSRNRGRFERAHGGTIFLDEIAELPLKAQVRLLRVLQNGEIERIGGSKTIHVDIRVIAASNRNLGELIDRKQFREDLWYRLNVFPVMVPPLRQRKEDIPLLLHHFIEKKSSEFKLVETPRVSSKTIQRLIHYDWPGNVRELENVVERAIILNRNGPLDFGPFVSTKNKYNKAELPAEEEQFLTLNEMDSLHIKRALSRTNGRINGPKGAAALLAINPNTLRSRIKKLGLQEQGLYCS